MQLQYKLNEHDKYGNILGKFICTKCNFIKNKPHYLKDKTTLCSKCIPKKKRYINTSQRLLNIFSGMQSRCYCKTNKSYKDYGQRGITIYNNWIHNKQSFIDWANNNGYTDNLTIERIDNNGNYQPDNCKWIQLQKQLSNTRRCIKNRFTEIEQLQIANEFLINKRTCINIRTKYKIDQKTLKKIVFKFQKGKQSCKS